MNEPDWRARSDDVAGSRAVEGAATLPYEWQAGAASPASYGLDAEPLQADGFSEVWDYLSKH